MNLKKVNQENSKNEVWFTKNGIKKQGVNDAMKLR